ncbi:DUF922 domain-containing Zn-dependent protease [Hymenobacter tibetensis]|jgi:hypothetical protein|uniref:DUF922 domain-containing Zn-dependent protease n=1 Tax=Hymenobacter tibetensis TaxID=497967 RepID=A0ABY4CVN5_9BACT|nr:DUF922 domain-containing protein [Hymenobacter tibetensis]UOG73539.1 DUF922 domain-containing Zn-dependent protease [Hymenobacter tibetensis]
MTFFSFLLFLLAQTLQNPVQTTPKPAPAKELIDWSAQRPLTWADFKSRPMAVDRLAALTSGTIDVQVGCTDFVFRSTVRAVFIPQESWVRDAAKATPALLRHEQLHFDITELHARMLRQKLSLVKLNCQHLNPAFNNLTKAAFATWQREEGRYDQETNHGLNAVKQKYWEEQVQVRLTQLNAFAL